MHTKKTASLVGENGNKLIIESNGQNKYQEYQIAVTVKSEWYQATVNCDISYDRLAKFLEDLSSDKKPIVLINEYSNFELNIDDLDNLGHYIISGDLLKSLNDDSFLRYSFETDNITLKKFESQISSIIKEI